MPVCGYAICARGLSSAPELAMIHSSAQTLVSHSLISACCYTDQGDGNKWSNGTACEECPRTFAAVCLPGLSSYLVPFSICLASAAKRLCVRIACCREPSSAFGTQFELAVCCAAGTTTDGLQTCAPCTDPNCLVSRAVKAQTFYVAEVQTPFGFRRRCPHV